MKQRTLSDIQAGIAELDKLSRLRALSDQESIQLERLIRLENEYARRAAKLKNLWLPEHDRTIIELRRAGKKYREIADRLGRSLNAVHTRRHYLANREAVQ